MRARDGDDRRTPATGLAGAVLAGAGLAATVLAGAVPPPLTASPGHPDE
ncbi:hypothetical protein [Streptomyces sp. PBH53]|nr:hypothetical protein [Streptomyces sp. PBH53]